MSLGYVHMFAVAWITAKIEMLDYTQNPIGIYEQVFCMLYFPPDVVDKHPGGER